MLRIVFYIIVAVLALSFFGITIQSIVHSAAGEANFSYLGTLLTQLSSYFVTLVSSVSHWLLNLAHQ